MTAVAGYINNFMPGLGLPELAEVMDVDAAIDAIPEPRQQNFRNADKGIGIVRRDFSNVLARNLFGLVGVDVVAPGLGGNGLLDIVGAFDALHQRYAVGADRDDGRCAGLIEVHTDYT